MSDYPAHTHCWHPQAPELNLMMGMRSGIGYTYVICCNCGIKDKRFWHVEERALRGQHGPHASAIDRFVVWDDDGTIKERYDGPVAISEPIPGPPRKRIVPIKQAGPVLAFLRRLRRRMQGLDTS